MNLYTRGKQALQRVVSEMIGTTRRLATRALNLWSAQARDLGRADYAFWDKARRCKARGLELSGLFLKPLGSKVAAWTLGRPPKWRLDNRRAQDALNTWWSEHHADVLRAYEEAIDLADCFIVVNADLSVTVVPPNVVDPIVDEADFSQIIGWRIAEKHPHPTQPGRDMIIIDEYRLEGRTRTITINGATVRTERYRNLLGRLPVVKLSNDVGSNEVFGHAEGEALIPALHRYGEIFDAALDGNKRQGRPTPVIEKMGTAQDIDRFWERYGRTETQTLDDGTTEETQVIDFDADQLLTLGGAAEFSWKGPGSFTQDTERLLALIFYLLLQHTEIPEWAWGTAIASSKASAETQVEPFVKWIEKKRGQCGWLTELAQVVLGYLALTERGIQSDARPSVQWEPLMGQDRRLTLDTLTWARNEGLIDEETALALSPLDIDDVAGVLDRAHKEQEERDARARQFDFSRANEDEIDRLEQGGGDDAEDHGAEDDVEEAELMKAGVNGNGRRAR